MKNINKTSKILRSKFYSLLSITLVSITIAMMTSCSPASRENPMPGLLLLQNGHTKNSEQKTVSFSYDLTAVFGQKLKASGKDVIGKSNGAARAVESITGTLTVNRLDQPDTQTFNWYGTLDEPNFQLDSTKTIILEPGDYDFSLILDNGTYQYAGSASNFTIVDGENTVPMTVSPVIGDVTTDVVVTDISALRFQYDPNEISSAGLTTPSLGVIVDDGDETVLNLDPATGISDAYINVEPGTHTIRLKLYDTGIQVGKSVSAQESVTIVATEDVVMDLIPLHGETVLSLSADGGDATFNFNIPSDVVEEAGGLANLETIFQLNGPVNGNHETSLVLSADGTNYIASVTYNDFRYDTIAMSLVFNDTATGETLGSCNVADVTLTESAQSVNCNLELRRRALATGNLLAVVGVNVFDQSDFAVAGAEIYVDDELKGLTGSGSFGTAGYLKLYLKEGSHIIRGESGGLYGEAQVDAIPLKIYNRDILLGEPLTIQSFQQFQNIPTNHGRDMEYFEMDGESYLAVANAYNNSTYNVDSKIYRWESNSWVEFQSIPTHHARIFEYFEIAGERFLAVANNHSEPTHNINSYIYRWDGNQFVEYQAIPTNGAHHLAFFEIGGLPYLAIANQYNNTTFNINSRIYQWDGSYFVEIQSIATSGAIWWEHFEIAGETYLALASYRNDSTYNIDSKIYRWNGSQFVEFQALPTSHGFDWEYFEINGESYLAVANHYNGSTYNLNSNIYKWDGTQFVQYQAIPTIGALNWEFFERGGEFYLAVANNYNDSTHSVNSKVYKWDGSQFVDFLSIPTIGAQNVTYFEINGIPYLGYLNGFNGISYNLNSVIYQAVFE